MVRRLDADGDFSQATVQQFWDKERNVYVRLMKAIERQFGPRLYESHRRSRSFCERVRLGLKTSLRPGAFETTS